MRLDGCSWREKDQDQLADSCVPDLTSIQTVAPAHTQPYQDEAQLLLRQAQNHDLTSVAIHANHHGVASGSSCRHHHRNLTIQANQRYALQGQFHLVHLLVVARLLETLQIPGFP